MCRGRRRVPPPPSVPATGGFAKRALLVLVSLIVVLGCDGDRRQHRTIFVEVVSLPSGLLMAVAIGYFDPIGFEARTPIAQNVRADVRCTSGMGGSPQGCEILATARVKEGDPAGKHVTMCLTDAGERGCGTSPDGDVTMSLVVQPER